MNRKKNICITAIACMPVSCTTSATHVLLYQDAAASPGIAFNYDPGTNKEPLKLKENDFLQRKLKKKGKKRENF